MRDEVREHTVDADGCEKQRHRAEDQRQEHRGAAACERRLPVWKERAVPFAPELGELARRSRERSGHVLEVACRGGPLHLRPAADVLAGEPVARVLDVRPIVNAGPFNFERHDSRNRRGTAAEERVADVVEIEDVHVVRLVNGVARSGVDATDIARGKSRRPEETARCDAGIEVDDLLPRTGVVDVNSYEPERPLARFSVHAAVDALHKPHVRGDERQLDAFAGRHARSRDGAVHVRQPYHPIEVRDGRGFGVDRIEAAVRGRPYT